MGAKRLIAIKLLKTKGEIKLKTQSETPLSRLISAIKKEGLNPKLASNCRILPLILGKSTYNKDGITVVLKKGFVWLIERLPNDKEISYLVRAEYIAGILEECLPPPVVRISEIEDYLETSLEEILYGINPKTRGRWIISPDIDVHIEDILVNERGAEI